MGEYTAAARYYARARAIVESSESTSDLHAFSGMPDGTKQKLSSTKSNYGNLRRGLIAHGLLTTEIDLIVRPQILRSLTIPPIVVFVGEDPTSWLVEEDYR